VIFLEKEKFLATCPKCQKTHARPFPSDEIDFLNECGSIVDSLIVVAECEECKEKSAK
jgi:hypothetical protein